MKKQKIKKSGFYGEIIFNITAYNATRNFTVGKRNSKRAYLSVTVLIYYMDNLPNTSGKKTNGKCKK